MKQRTSVSVELLLSSRTQERFRIQRRGWHDNSTRRVGAVLALALLAVTPQIIAQNLAVDFDAHQERVAPQKPVVFEDFSTSDGIITNRLWDFGDGTPPIDSEENTTITHSYTTLGIYDVTLTVTDTQEQDTLLRRAYIQVLDPPFAEFYGRRPRVADAAPLTVTFEDHSDYTGFDPADVSGTWSWGDGSTTPYDPDQPIVAHTYNADGGYTVSLELEFPSGETDKRIRPNYVVIGTGIEVTPNGADLEATDAIPDTHALLPLTNWVPLVNIVLKWSNEEESAPRNLVRLRYQIVDDPVSPRPYDRLFPVFRDELFEFALIRETDPPEEFGTLDPGDEVIYVWDKDGTPLAQASGNATPAYDVDFAGITRGRGTFANPEYPVPNSALGESYFLAARTSALWINMTTLACHVTDALMLTLNGEFPIEPETGEPVDTYEPDFFVGDTLLTGAYSSSFAVYDVTGSLDPVYSVEFANAWAWPTWRPTRTYLESYTPTSEYLRPRWDKSATAFDFVAGEWLEIRRLFAIETWTAVIGINLHMTTASVMETEGRQQPLGAVALLPGVHPNPQAGIPVDTPAPGSFIEELNVVMRDIGADPLGPPGNGGLNPSEGLERMSYNVEGGDDFAFHSDCSFNGVWVWKDVDNNFVFDRPTPAGDGVTLLDRPALPGDILSPEVDWEWVPYPSDGGDPWWKIKLELDEYRFEPDPFIEVTPDGPPPIPTAFYCDFFVCIRPDSGFEDSSMLPGDGTGMLLGVDTQVMIEPRDPTSPFQGGMIINTQIPNEYGDLWQTHPTLNPGGNIEPWWPQRTMNQHVTKPVKSGFEVHDLVLTYESNNNWKTWTDIDYSTSNTIFGLGIPTFQMFIPWFDAWLDPYGVLANQFTDTYFPDVFEWLLIVSGVDDSENGGVQQPYETAPFYSIFDVPPTGPRSFWYPRPPDQPERPSYGTWPLGLFGTGATLPPGQYPRERDWPDDNVRARKLYQHVESDSAPVALLGINLVGANDPITNEHNALHLEQITVALWGPDLDRDEVSDFTPEDLKELDPAGLAGTSGVALFIDTGSGTLTDVLGGDIPLEVNGLEWPSAPEWIDRDGDMQPDDLDGDGDVDDVDKAWVLRFRTKELWRVPAEDFPEAAFTLARNAGDLQAISSAKDAVSVSAQGPSVSEATRTTTITTPDGRTLTVVPSMGSWGPLQLDVPTGLGPGTPAYAERSGSSEGPSHEYSAKSVHTIDLKDGPILDSERNSAITAKQLPGDPSGFGNWGDDLFLVIRTSDTIGRFERIAAYVPAWLPERPAHDQAAGIQFSPQYIPDRTAYQKHDPEEQAVQSFFEHDLLEANVAVEIVDLTGVEQLLPNTGQPLPVLGLDISTNRGARGTAASGQTGVGDHREFRVVGANWQPGAFVDYWLIDSEYESYQIVGNTVDTLALLSGFPRNGPWYIAKDPTFLEQVIVEFYDEPGAADFNILEDLKPLHIDQRVSGVALYRDNDFHVGNRNAVFDPDIDIPLPLDYPPFMTGMVGEPNMQVMFVFSSPGTDDVPLPGQPAGLANQPRRRQIVPDSVGIDDGPDSGPDFFVVLRAAGTTLAEDADFRVAIVSLGPNTPTEPDPDTFPPPPLGQQGEFDIFSEFPWGYRAVGLITFFKDITEYDPLDNSGYNWVRTSCNKYTRTNLTTIVKPAAGAGDVVITSVSHETLPRTIPPDGIPIVIEGSGFGTEPTVTINATELIVDSASNTTITATIPGNTVLSEPVVLTVTNPQTGRSGTWTEITLTEAPVGDAPTITRVEPTSGTRDSFPVSVIGTRFDEPAVYFGATQMPILESSQTRILVAFPTGGLPATGPLDVKVVNTTTSLFATLADGFTYVNYPAEGIVPVRPCFVATAAYGSPFETRLATFREFRDRVLLKSAAGASLVNLYYAVSPPIADQIAECPGLAGLVRGVLLPVAWSIESPAVVFGVLIVACFAGWLSVRLVKRRILAR